MTLRKIRSFSPSYFGDSIESKVDKGLVCNYSSVIIFNKLIKRSVAIIIAVTTCALHPAMAQSKMIELNLKCHIEGKEISISGTKPLGTTSVIAKVKKFDDLFISIEGSKLNLAVNTLSHVKTKSVDRSEDGIFWIYQKTLDSTGSTETDIKINRILGTIEASNKYIFDSGPSWIDIWTGLCSSISKEKYIF